VKGSVFSRGHRQHVDCGAVVSNGASDLLDGLNAAIHQLTSSLASQPQQHQQDIPYHHSTANHTSTAHPCHS